ncbi:MAG: hypothetical protein KIT33_13560 [Candidatus Kapabacteria bacterium]|nr:hypothetical protein [Candidatus Kapabacteria bacterium]
MLSWETNWAELYPLYAALYEESERRSNQGMTNADGSRMVNLIEESGGYGFSRYKPDRTGCASGAANGQETKKGQAMYLSDILIGFTGLNITDGKTWSKMDKAQKETALSSANNLLRYLQKQSGFEWSYSIFEVMNEDGTTSIIASNFKTDGESNSVMPDFQYKGNGNLVNVWGFGHSHPWNSPHSAPDLGYMAESNHRKDGFIMVVVSPDYNDYLEVVNNNLLSESWIDVKGNYGKEIAKQYINFMINNQGNEWTDVFLMDRDTEQCISCGLHFQRFTPRVMRRR